MAGTPPWSPPPTRSPAPAPTPRARSGRSRRPGRAGRRCATAPRSAPPYAPCCAAADRRNAIAVELGRLGHELLHVALPHVDEPRAERRPHHRGVEPLGHGHQAHRVGIAARPLDAGPHGRRPCRNVGGDCHAHRFPLLPLRSGPLGPRSLVPCCAVTLDGRSLEAVSIHTTMACRAVSPRARCEKNGGVPQAVQAGLGATSPAPAAASARPTAAGRSRACRPVVVTAHTPSPQRP